MEYKEQLLPHAETLDKLTDGTQGFLVCIEADKDGFLEEGHLYKYGQFVCEYHINLTHENFSTAKFMPFYKFFHLSENLV